MLTVVELGRTTPSLRQLVEEYVNRFSKMYELATGGDKEKFRAFLEDLDTTISMCAHIGVVDPLEVLLIHLVRRLDKIAGTPCGAVESRQPA